MTIFAMCLSSLNVLAQAIVNIEDLRREGEVGFLPALALISMQLAVIETEIITQRN